jgi:putative phosphoesterase
MRRLGVLADTHGSVLPDILVQFEQERVDCILHAGDIGSPSVISQLQEIAPVIAVAGNGDERWFHRYPWDLRLNVGDRRIFLCHWYDNYGRIHPGYRSAVDDWRPHVLIYGHTHRALLEEQGQVLHLNPGYAGAPEPARQRSIGLLDLETLEARIVAL